MLQLVLEAVLMEGVFAEEVDGRQTEPSSAQTALHHLEYLGTESTGRERQRQENLQGRGCENGTNTLGLLLRVD